ncbi:TetR/AcrR family transcriptional regulator [Oribacterium sp. WCC10]|uniref:TetR/AcrR family transcriptional regulator n=1 Tax=Oribacterium sp. WCC10 TaxID=1855343 RepID=UPI0008E1BE0C|nr:TetR/AcrR family transcriptional regulator [Oribacterium sp. WCC10]SFG74540.1 DNA-binding transcriptional regulator, AcrR family [Oribacterium sp. WCC10]
MRDKVKDAEQMAKKRKAFIEKAYELFSKSNIESVSLQDIAEATDYGIATLYRYFVNKPTLVIETASWKWQQIMNENKERRPSKDFSGMTAADILEFYLDSFITLYKEYPDVLRFNQFFNIYIRSENVSTDSVDNYHLFMSELADRFHLIYVKAGQDHTVRTDIPEEDMFSVTLHLMMAAVTRYSVGLVYIPNKGFDAEKELLVLKEMIMNRYTVSN